MRIGFERTLEQDAGFGLRRLIDIACKALSPAVNDPYTAVQAIHRLAVLCARLAARPLGHLVMSATSAGVTVIIPAPQFSDYLTTMIGLIRRYGAAEPTVAQALLRLLDTCATVSIDDEGGRRWARMQREADTIVAAIAAVIAAASVHPAPATRASPTLGARRISASLPSKKTSTTSSPGKFRVIRTGVVARPAASVHLFQAVCGDGRRGVAAATCSRVSAPTSTVTCM